MELERDLYLLSRGSRAVVLPHSLSAIMIDVLLALYLTSVFLTCWSNESIRGNSLQKVSVLDCPFMLILRCCNTSGLKEASLDLVQVKRKISPTTCPTTTESLHLRNKPLAFLTSILNVCPKAKQSNWRFQMQSECNVMWTRQNSFNWSANVNVFPKHRTLQ